MYCDIQHIEQFHDELIHKIHKVCSSYPSCESLISYVKETANGPSATVNH